MCLVEEYLPVAAQPVISKLYVSGGGTSFFYAWSIYVGRRARRLNFLEWAEVGTLYVLGAGLLAYLNARRRKDWNLVFDRLVPKVLDLVVIVEGSK